MNLYEGSLYLESPEKIRIGIVAARFNDLVVSRLIDGAEDALLRHGVLPAQISLVKVPGAFELPLVAKKMAESGKYDAVIALGAVIRGDTDHYNYVCSEVSKGIAAVGLESGLPVLFGVLTCDTLEQALLRAGSKAGNKGFECGVAALEMISLLEKL